MVQSLKSLLKLRERSKHKHIREDFPGDTLSPPLYGSEPAPFVIISPNFSIRKNFSWFRNQNHLRYSAPGCFCSLLAVKMVLNAFLLAFGKMLTNPFWWKSTKGFEKRKINWGACRFSRILLSSTESTKTVPIGCKKYIRAVNNRKQRIPLIGWLCQLNGVYEVFVREFCFWAL